jgi:hypothetical protein
MTLFWVDAVKIRRCIPTFRRNIVSPSSGLCLSPGLRRLFPSLRGTPPFTGWGRTSLFLGECVDRPDDQRYPFHCTLLKCITKYNNYRTYTNFKLVTKRLHDVSVALAEHSSAGVMPRVSVSGTGLAGPFCFLPRARCDGWCLRRRRRGCPRPRCLLTAPGVYSDVRELVRALLVVIQDRDDGHNTFLRNVGMYVP